MQIFIFYMKEVQNDCPKNSLILEKGGNGTGSGWYIEGGFKKHLKWLFVTISLKYRRVKMTLYDQRGRSPIDFGMSGWMIAAAVRF